MTTVATSTNTANTFANLPLTHIATSQTNPRKHFDPTKLAELAESIKASGVHQPVLVRPLPGTRVDGTDRAVQYELVCGERRYRASELAGVGTIPAMICALTTDQVLEIQLIENLQRDDLNALEEAEGYQALMAHSGITAEEVGTKIGKSRAYVYARTKLLDLSQEVKQAMREGQLDFSRALLIARIPDSTLQAKALEAATHKDYQGEVPSVRSFQTWLQSNVMLRLDKAVFKITDTRLVQAAGSCTACPKRTGANPDLFADASSADLCIDPPCYQGKEAAHRAALMAMAAKKGMQFIEGKEARELIPHQYTDRINGYLPLNQKREDCTKDGQTGFTMRELLGDDAPAPVLIENPYTKALIEAVPEDEAEGVLLAKGYLRGEEDDEAGNARNKATPKQLEQQIKHLQGRADRDLASATEAAVLQAIRDGIHVLVDSVAKTLMGPAMLRAFLSTAIERHNNTFMAAALAYVFEENDDEQDGLVQHIRAADHATLYRAAAIVLLENETEDCYGDDDHRPIAEHLAMAANVNTKAVTKEATKVTQAKFAGEIAAIQAQIDALAKPKADPVASVSLIKGEGGEPKPKPAKTATPRKAKLSAAEATSGIAAAMQGIERATTASPEAPQHQRGVGFAVGQRVRITTADDRLGAVARKWAGKEGTIAKTNVDHDPDVFDVTFRGKHGGIASFRTDQLEGVAV